MKRRKLIPLLAALLILAAPLTACSAKGSYARDEDAPNYSANDQYDAGGMEMEAEKPTAAPTVDPTGGGSYERKVIRTVKMTCETKAYDSAISVILTALAEHGGYVEESSSKGTGYGDVRGSERYASYTLRVPAENLDAFLEALRTDEGIRILNQSATSDEITATYYDTVSRLETLEAEKASLTAMLEGFTDYSDINAMLRVQERLYNVIEEIEALKTRLNLYDGQVAMSTVHLTVNEVITYTEVVEPDPTFSQRVSKAFRESWADFGQGCQDFAVWFVEALPTLLVLAVIGGGITAVVLILNRKSAKRRLSRTAPPSATPPYRSDDKK